MATAPELQITHLKYSALYTVWQLSDYNTLRVSDVYTLFVREHVLYINMYTPFESFSFQSYHDILMRM